MTKEPQSFANPLLFSSSAGFCRFQGPSLQSPFSAAAHPGMSFYSPGQHPSRPLLWQRSSTAVSQGWVALHLWKQSLLYAAPSRPPPSLLIIPLLPLTVINTSNAFLTRNRVRLSVGVSRVWGRAKCLQQYSCHHLICMKKTQRCFLLYLLFEANKYINVCVYIYIHTHLHT